MSDELALHEPHDQPSPDQPDRPGDGDPGGAVGAGGHPLALTDLLAAHHARRALSAPAPSPLYTREQCWPDTAAISLDRVSIASFELDDGQRGHFATWVHPLEGTKTVTSAQVAFLRTFISPGDLVIGIGAHSGDTVVPMAVVPMAVAAGPGGLCLAFEPNPAAFRVLCVNAWLNQHLGTIVPLRGAIMPAPGEYTFHYSDPQLCNGGYAEGLTAGVGVCGHAHPLRVNGIRLDTVLGNCVTRASLARWSFCKVDVEGADMLILESHAELFREWLPALQVELFPGLTADERRHWYAVIVDELHYQPFRPPRGVMKPMAPLLTYDDYVPLTIDETLAATSVIDAICLPKE